MTLTVKALASRIDHALLQPALNDYDFDAGCDIAQKWAVASLCVKSADVERARLRLGGSPVAVCAVVGFPHGNVSTEVLGLETRRALESGAGEIDAVVSLSRVLSDDWDAVRRQLDILQAMTIGPSACLKAIFETGLIDQRERKIRLCEICKELGVGFVKTSTGFAYGRNEQGTPVQLGATVEDVRLMVRHAGPVCRVKASGGIRSLTEAAAFLQAGAARLGTASTTTILDEASRVLPRE